MLAPDVCVNIAVSPAVLVLWVKWFLAITWGVGSLWMILNPNGMARTLAGPGLQFSPTGTIIARVLAVLNLCGVVEVFRGRF